MLINSVFATHNQGLQYRLKIQDFISSLPQSVVKGEDISIPDNVARKILKLANVHKTDIFYELGCGNNNTVLLFWFTDPDIIDQMIKRFENELESGARIITIWSPLDLMLPAKTEFPFFVCEKPFKYAKNIKQQIKAIYGNPCIDFTASWLLAEKYLHELEVVPTQYLRFVNMLQSVIIWINAWNIGVACEDEIPPPVQTYIGILKTFFNIDLSDMIHKIK